MLAVPVGARGQQTLGWREATVKLARSAVPRDPTLVPSAVGGLRGDHSAGAECQLPRPANWCCRPIGVTRTAALKQPSARSGARAHRRKPRVIAETQMSKILTVVLVMQPRLNAKPLIFIGIQTPWGGVQVLFMPLCWSIY